jgi:hypothetical protein
MGHPKPEQEIPDRRTQTGINEPDGWYGIRSRSRFLPVSRDIQVGHGGQQTSQRAPSRLPEPNRQTQFPIQRENRPLAWLPFGIGQRKEDVAALGSDDLAEGYRPFRGFFHEALTETRAVSMPSWVLAGPIARARQRLHPIADRREFMAQSQTFKGEHTEVPKGARMPTSPVRMLPARQPRLTRYAPPPSFGLQTEMIE